MFYKQIQTVTNGNESYIGLKIINIGINLKLENRGGYPPFLLKNVIDSQTLKNSPKNISVNKTFININNW